MGQSIHNANYGYIMGKECSLLRKERHNIQLLRTTVAVIQSGDGKFAGRKEAHVSCASP